MRLPIPDDWDGQSWLCCQVEFPDSPQYVGLLYGLLTMLARGRFWDEKTGSIKDAQAVGWEIHERNIPLTNCSGGEVPVEPEKEIVYRLMSSDDDDDGEGGEGNMAPLCGYNPKAFRIEGGYLYVRDFCGDWVKIGAISGDNQDISGGDDPYKPPELEGGGYSSCGMATAVMEMFHQVAESVFDEGGSMPWNVWGHVKADCPGIGMDSKWVVIAATGVALMEGLIASSAGAYDPDPFDESTWQSVKCRLFAWFEDDQDRMTDGDAIREKIQNLFADEWWPDAVVNAPFVDIARAINRETFEAFAMTGASVETDECDCPEPPILITPSKIFFNGSFTWAGNDPDSTIELTAVEYGGRRVKITQVGEDVQFPSITDADFGLYGAEAGDYITVRLYAAQGSKVPSKEWETEETVPPTGWLEISVVGTSGGNQRLNYTNYVEFISSAGTPSAVRIEDARMYPPNSGPYEWVYYLEIVGVNGEALTPIGP